MSRFNLQDTKIAILGLGYVGLPLAIEFSKKYPVLGFDINQQRINELLTGYDNTGEADIDELKKVIKGDELTSVKLSFSSVVSDLDNYNVYIVTVPTPVDIAKLPDLRPLLKASELIGKALHYQ